MLIKEVLAELAKTGRTVQEIAKSIDGISEKKLRLALNESGYIFSNQAPKGWHFTGEGNPPLEKSIFDYVKPSSQRSEQTVKRTHTANVKSISQLESENRSDDVNLISQASELSVIPNTPKSDISVKDYSHLMYEELKAIRGLLQDGEPKGKAVPADDLLSRISNLDPDVVRTRKTITIDENLGAKLDVFAKERRMTKSDLLEVAIADLLERYK